jgi:small-conductance mechanosensitive channel
MKSLRRNLSVVALGALLIASVAAAFLTRQWGTRPDAKPATPTTSPIDSRLLETARQSAALADSVDEQALAREALRLADQEFDHAFAMAMREAALAPPPTSDTLKQLVALISELKERVQTSQAQVNKLSRTAAPDEAAATRLELAKAQLALDQEELTEAQEELARQGGDRRTNLERVRKAHEDAQHVVAGAKAAEAPAASTLAEKIQAWLVLRNRLLHLDAARQQALNRFASLTRQHFGLRRVSPGEAPAEIEDEEETAAAIERLRRLSDEKKTLVQLDQRILACQSLADVYRRWGELIENRQSAVVHLVLVSSSGIISVLLGIVVTGQLVRRYVRNQNDRRRAYQLRVMGTIAAQIVGALIIAFIIFGRPTQISTIIGLTTAGLTVVLKDFIVAFFGWFTLMGKNGIRIGDWVEIEGVSGEVVEIGLLKTVVLEMGSTSTGHPTGRRVSFMNKFAIERHFFNFSTAGQWLWDELQLTLPSTADAYQTAMRIRECVEKLTAEEAQLAEAEWERVTRQYETRAFSAKPAVDLRPSSSGLDVVVRYITRGPQRFEVRSRLFEAIIDLIHKR